MKSLSANPMARILNFRSLSGSTFPRCDRKVIPLESTPYA